MQWFNNELFKFLADLKDHNDKEWFAEHKARYIDHVREPSRAFIRAVTPEIQSISHCYAGDDRVNGGSLFRIYRDTRFSNDKTPYKSWVGMRFRHERARQATAPAFYLHLSNDQCFIGAGCWHPEKEALLSIRQFLLNNPNAWQLNKDQVAQDDDLTFGGASLIRMPRGFDPEHPLAEDIKRKDFVVIHEFNKSRATQEGFLDYYISMCRKLAPFVDYLCAALDLEF